MPRFNGIVITEGGQALLAKAQIGKKLNFTKMQLGSNNDTSSPTTKTAVIAPFLTTAITEIKITGDGKARISTYISNQTLKQSYVWREIGLFARDPDTNEEILYAYKCAGENGETLPAGGEADIIEKIFDIIINISNATNVTATIDASTVYIKTRDIITELESCENEDKKVPSAKLFYDTIKDIINNIYPIGITISFNDNEDHSNFCGLSWKRDNEGLFPVGYKNGDDDFGTVGQTGGSNTKTISKENLPNYELIIKETEHKHSFSGSSNVTDTYPNETTSVNTDYGNSRENVYSSNTSSKKLVSISGETSGAKTNITVSSGGKGEKLDIKPKYMVKAYWTRIS